MTEITARITDRSAINALSHLESASQTAVMKGLRKAGLLMGSAIASRAPRKSGRLARSFLSPIVHGNSVTIGRGVPIYGAIHEYGGTITPKSGPYLVFQVNGQWVRARQVQIKEKRFARGGMEATQAQAPILIGREIAAAFN